MRARTDDQLAGLLRRRPDLALPAPADVATLAGRVSIRSSVQRAIDGLDAFVLRVLETLVLVAEPGDTASVARAAATLGVPVERAVHELLEAALMWGDQESLHPVATVRDVLGPYPAGLGRSAAALLGAQAGGVLADPRRVAELIAAGDPAEREILDRLAAGPPVGLVRGANRPVVDGGATPPQRLIGRGLLVPLDAQTVELPREVGLVLRARQLAPAAEAPEIESVDRAPAELDRLGSTAVLETLRLVEALGETWTGQPPAVLRSGGVGVRELRRTARELGVAEAAAALIVEVAYAAGLVGPTNGLDPVYLPSAEYDGWRRHDPAQRWTALASAWLAMTRQPALVGRRGDRDRVITALGPDAERGTVPALRATVLAVLTTLPPGAAPVSADAVLGRLTWQAPRRASSQRPLIEAVLAEADRLGVTAAGGLTGYSRTLLHGTRTVAEQVLADALPEPVDHFMVQPDLTIVVPGPPTAELGAELALAADLESTGGASVYRITAATVRRALDAGRSGSDVTRLITEHSRTPIPQALSYLIDDAARRHGLLRTGAAASYLRCDDEALLARVLADRGTETLQLRRIAPTIVVSAAPVGRVLDVLRSAGFAPAAEAPDGEVITLDAEPTRAPSRPAARSLRARAAAEPGAHVAELVHRIRSGDALSTVSRRLTPIAQQVPGVTSATTMGLLREAIRAERRVWLGYANADGTASRHNLLPISMGGGFVRGHEPHSPRLQAFSLHRITAVGFLDGGSDDELDDAEDPA